MSWRETSSMRCVGCGGNLDCPEGIAGMYFCGSTCVSKWYNEHWWKCREIYRFFLRHPERRPHVGYAQNSYVDKAKRMYWDKRPGMDHTERLINRNYQYQPKRKEYLLNKHRMTKFSTQIMANKQHAEWESHKKNYAKISERYKIKDIKEMMSYAGGGKENT